MVEGDDAAAARQSFASTAADPEDEVRLVDRRLRIRHRGLAPDDRQFHTRQAASLFDGRTCPALPVGEEHRPSDDVVDGCVVVESLRVDGSG